MTILRDPFKIQAFTFHVAIKEKVDKTKWQWDNVYVSIGIHRQHRKALILQAGKVGNQFTTSTSQRPVFYAPKRKEEKKVSRGQKRKVKAKKRWPALIEFISIRVQVPNLPAWTSNSVVRKIHCQYPSDWSWWRSIQIEQRSLHRKRTEWYQPSLHCEFLVNPVGISCLTRSQSSKRTTFKSI